MDRNIIASRVIPLKIERTDLFEFEYIAVAPDYTSYFNDTTDPSNIHLASIAVKNSNGTQRWINYKVYGASPLSHEVSDCSIKYLGIYQGIDIEYVVEPERMKEYIYIDSITNYKDIIFTLKFEGCRWEFDKDGSIVFYDIDTSEFIWKVEAPYIVNQPEINVAIIEGELIEGYKSFILRVYSPESAQYPMIIDPTTITSVSYEIPMLASWLAGNGTQYVFYYESGTNAFKWSKSTDATTWTAPASIVTFSVDTPFKSIDIDEDTTNGILYIYLTYSYSSTFYYRIYKMVLSTEAITIVSGPSGSTSMLSGSMMYDSGYIYYVSMSSDKMTISSNRCNVSTGAVVQTQIATAVNVFNTSFQAISRDLTNHKMHIMYTEYTSAHCTYVGEVNTLTGAVSIVDTFSIVAFSPNGFTPYYYPGVAVTKGSVSYFPFTANTSSPDYPMLVRTVTNGDINSTISRLDSTGDNTKGLYIWEKINTVTVPFDNANNVVGILVWVNVNEDISAIELTESGYRDEGMQVVRGLLGSLAQKIVHIGQRGFYYNGYMYCVAYAREYINAAYVQDISVYPLYQYIQNTPGSAEITTIERIVDQGSPTLPSSERIVISDFASLPSSENIKLPGIQGDSSIAANENVYESEEATIATTELIKEQGLDNIDAIERVLTGPESATIDTTERVTYGGSSNLTLKQRIKGVASSTINAPEAVYVPEVRKTSIGYGQWTDLQNSTYVYKDLALEGVPAVNTYVTFNGTIPAYSGTSRVSQSVNNPLYKCTSITVYPYTTAPKAPYLKVELREKDNINSTSRILFTTMVANSGSSINVDTSSSQEFNADKSTWLSNSQYTIEVYIGGIELGGSPSSNFGVLIDSSGFAKCTIKGYMIGRATSSSTQQSGFAYTPWINKLPKDAMVKFAMVGPSINPNVEYNVDLGTEGFVIYEGQYFKIPASVTSYRIGQNLNYGYNSYSLVTQIDIEEAYIADIVRLDTNEYIIANESSFIPIIENIANGTGSDIISTAEYILPFNYQMINTVEKIYQGDISSLNISENIGIGGTSLLPVNERIVRAGWRTTLALKDNVKVQGTSTLPMNERASGPELIRLPIGERIVLSGSSLIITTERIRRSGTDSLALTERSIRSNKKYLTINERPINSTSRTLPMVERSIYKGAATLDMNEAVGRTGITSITASEKVLASGSSSINISERTIVSDVSVLDMTELVRLDGSASIDVSEKVIVSSSSTIRLRERISADTVSFIKAYEFIDGDDISILHIDEYVSDESINLQVRKALYRTISQ